MEDLEFIENCQNFYIEASDFIEKNYQIDNFYSAEVLLKEIDKTKKDESNNDL